MQEQTYPANINEIIIAVCDEFEVTLDQLFAREWRRKWGNRTIVCKRCPPRKVTIAKQVICYLDRKYSKVHFRLLIRILGYENHSPITKNIKTTMNVMSVDSDFENRIKKLEDKIKAPAVTEAN